MFPFVDGTAGAIWSMQEFVDRINNLKEMVTNNIVATSKEYDPFLITDHSFGKAGDDEGDVEEEAFNRARLAVIHAVRLSVPDYEGAVS